MNNKDFRSAVPDMPLSFARKMDETLERIENMEMKKRKMSPRALIICAVLAVTLIGSAIAATEYRVFDFLYWMNPLEDAEKLVQTNIGKTENEYVRVEIEEAAYDGQGVLLVLRATPLKPDTHPLYNSITDMENDPVWVYQRTDCEDGSYMIEFKGRNDGKEFVTYSVSINVVDENGGNIWLDGWDAQTEADGSVILYADGFSEEKLGETAILTAKVRSAVCAPDMKSKTDLPTEEITYTMPKADATRNYRLVPVSTEDVSHFDLLEGRVSFTPVRGYMTIRYAYQEKEDEPMGVTFKFYLPDGTEITVGSGGAISMGEENGYVIYEDCMEIQSYETLPETITVCVKVIGEARYLCDIECRVIEE